MRKVFVSASCLPGLLLAVQTVAQMQIPAPPQPTASAVYTIAGTVVNAITGEPLRRVTVAALSQGNDQTVEAIETDNEGRFALDGLPSGKYPISASKRGFLTAFYDQHDEGYNSAIVTGEGQQTTGLVFKLLPGATLHGVVTADGGDPVEGAEVMLFRKPHNHNPGSRISQVNVVATDDTGAYEFADLPTGEYLLAVTAVPWYVLHRGEESKQQRPENDPAFALDVAYPITYFDSTTDESSAAPIRLTAGSREEANINLHAVPALRLLVSIPETRDRQIASPVLRRSVFGTEIPSVGNGFFPGKETSSVEFTGVAPGHYQLTQGDPPRIVELDATASQEVDPGIGTPTVSVSGALRSTGGATFPGNVSVFLMPQDGGQGSQPPVNCVNGSFTFDSVPQGTWKLIAGGSGKLMAVQSITIGEKTQAGNLLAVHDKPLQIVATVSLSDTRIEGVAKKKEKGQAGVMIVLVPDDPAANGDQFRRDQSDSDGSFALLNVAPGEYTVVAIEDGWDLDWARPQVITRYLPKGVAVKVAETSGKLLRLPEGVPVQSR
jgi:5-hydroxyisourate hydrolase-like protein (transthyretin family)